MLIWETQDHASWLSDQSHKQTMGSWRLEGPYAIGSMCRLHANPPRSSSNLGSPLPTALHLKHRLDPVTPLLKIFQWVPIANKIQGPHLVHMSPCMSPSLQPLHSLPFAALGIGKSGPKGIVGNCSLIQSNSWGCFHLSVPSTGPPKAPGVPRALRSHHRQE